jgi:ATP-binding cassette subfamily F protein 3
LLQPFNVLIMDEPTNHLDIKSKNVLKDALRNFEGTLILVSHDRDFLQGLTNKVYEFKDHNIREYLGDIEYFLEKRNLENLREAEKKTVVAKEAKILPVGGKQSYEDQKKQKSLNNRLSKIEANINKLEREIKVIDVDLAISYEETIAAPNFFENYQAKKDKVSKLMKDWEEVTMQLETLVP